VQCIEICVRCKEDVILEVHGVILLLDRYYKSSSTFDVPVLCTKRCGGCCRCPRSVFCFWRVLLQNG
jgi:hypothetical protein